MLIGDTSKIELQFGCVGFWGEGKTGAPGEKPLGARKRTNNKLNPHMTPGLGVEPGPHWWEASALTTAPSLLTCEFDHSKQFLQCKSTIKKVIYFTGEVKEILENLNESRRILCRWSHKDSCFQALQFLLYAPSSLKQSFRSFPFLWWKIDCMRNQQPYCLL